MLVVVGGIGVMEQGLVGMVVLPGGDDDLRGIAGAEELEGLALGLSLNEVPPGGAEAAKGFHDPPAVLAGTHGDLREGVAFPPGRGGARVKTCGRSLPRAPAEGGLEKSPDTPGSPEGNTEGPGTASSEPLLPS